MEKYTHHIPPPCQEQPTILHVDEHLLVVNKPAGLLSVPGRFIKDCVLSRMKQLYPGVVIVHRLDLDTSGILVLSRSKLATSDINRQFRQRSINKQYLALVYGNMASDSGEIDYPIAPDPDKRPKQRIDGITGKPALTRYEVVKRASNYTRVLLQPVTGRSHQLRIHLAHIGHPILGCDLYARAAALNAAPRLCLHAKKLSLHHPATGEPVTFECAETF